MSRVVQLIERDEFGNNITVLDINGPNRGRQGVSMTRGLQGLYHTPTTPIRESAAFQEGSSPGAGRVEERLFDMNLLTHGRSGAHWEQIDSDLWEMLTTDRDCVLRVESQISEPREIMVRLDRKPVDLMDDDPADEGEMLWKIVLVACDPYWYSTELVDEWTNTNGTGVGVLRFRNPAIKESWPQFASGTIDVTETWTLPDGLAKYPVGHAKAGQYITHTLPPLGPGKEFLVDTHPLAETLMVMDDSQEWANMRAEEFEHAIQRRVLNPVEVPVKLVGGTTQSKIKVYIPQRWDRPWGGQIK